MKAREFINPKEGSELLTSTRLMAREEVATMEPITVKRSVLDVLNIIAGGLNTAGSCVDIIRAAIIIKEKMTPETLTLLNDLLDNVADKVMEVTKSVEEAMEVAVSRVKKEPLDQGTA
jgi:hypothetical protein